MLQLKRRDAVSLLGRIELQPSPEPSTNSAARMGFDPYITRRLFTFMPLRVLELPPQERTWEVLRSLFDGLEELHELTGARNLTTWQVGRSIWLPNAALTSQVSKVVGDVKVWKHARDHQLAYIRTTHMVRAHQMAICRVKLFDSHLSSMVQPSSEHIHSDGSWIDFFSSRWDYPTIPS